ncbi:MAG: hypothetical protein COB73_02675 [Flavobacteriaceae bacterium]|nr:MAG: hypothetical protein COB73_02675 [Flavobacteriaceae bacterium]
MQKLKAGALQYTIFISVLILLLVSSFISLAYLQQKTRMSASFFQETIQHCTMGFEYLATHQTPYNQEIEISFNDEIESKVTLTKKHWGLFDIVHSKVQIKKEVFERIAMVGGHQSEKTALYLKENNKPLVLVGNTEIRGVSILPKQGARRGNIAGDSYYGSELIYGAIKQSTNQLPTLTTMPTIKNWIKGGFLNDELQPFDLYDGLQLKNSFNQPTLFFQSDGAIDLRFVELTGNITIQSNTKIMVASSSKLQDVILIAPEIEIENNTMGNFQAFASNQLLVGEGCNLEYPTVLCLIESTNNSFPLEEMSEEQSGATNNNQSTNNQIHIGSNTVVKGIVCYLSETTETNYKPQVVIDQNCIVAGEVYCDKNLELKGTVQGMVTTEAFIALQSGSVYINHIYNGSIIASELPLQYCGLQLQTTQTKVVKWLY